ncbi:MAG: DNA-directed RNA polymerase subunit omega [Syntrophales bacterium]|jgi:DNA-directed RNA polymerase subunit omega|nr:DNA-directed RNA polymerase subunit omega [Syntrophales bacterium]MDY0043862.1 DNA-directed RNA polymerase subunit omega [Syntrophales bacterium]
MARVTVEDSLKKAKNRFALTILTVQRVRQLYKGSAPLSEKKNNREVVTALREIAEGKVTYASPEYLSRLNEGLKQITHESEFVGTEDELD